MSGFGSRLTAAVAGRGPLCPGIDPHPELLAAWGLTADADGLAAFCDVCVAAFAGFAIVKPQVAFFETYGSAGFAVLERTMAELRANGVLVLADAKRGDIGTTMAAYAAAWAADGPLACDAVTASPYLGFGSLQPLLDTAAAHDRGVFVLAATSNPEGAAVNVVCAEPADSKDHWCDRERSVGGKYQVKVRYWEADPEAQEYTTLAPGMVKCSQFGDTTEVSQKAGGAQKYCQITGGSLANMFVLIRHAGDGTHLNVVTQKFVDRHAGFRHLIQ